MKLKLKKFFFVCPSTTTPTYLCHITTKKVVSSCWRLGVEAVLQAHGRGHLLFPNHKDCCGHRGKQRDRIRGVPATGQQGGHRCFDARDEARGTAAVEKLKELGLSSVIFHQLSSIPVTVLKDDLPPWFQGVAVNNAANRGFELVDDRLLARNPRWKSGMDGHQRIQWMLKNCQPTFDAAKEAVQANYHGTKQVTEALLPLILSSSDGRIINVTSGYSLLRFFRSEHLKQELNDVEKLTEERLDELLAMFLNDFEAGEMEARGWPTEFSAYKVAKAAMNAYSRLVARRHPALRVNCVDPGYVSTDMTGHSGLLTPEEGGARVVAVAQLPEGAATGAFFDGGEASPSFV